METLGLFIVFRGFLKLGDGSKGVHDTVLSISLFWKIYIKKKSVIMLPNSMISTLKIYVCVIWKDYHPRADNCSLLRMGVGVTFIFFFALICILHCNSKCALPVSLEEVT